MPMQLQRIATGEPVKPGDPVVTFRGEQAVLVHASPPHKPGSTGRVAIRFDGQEGTAEFYPSVIDCRFVTVEG